MKRATCRWFTLATLCTLSSIALAYLVTPANAQAEWPSGKPITYVVPYPPGGTTDILGRRIAQRLSPLLGATIVVENKAGATGTIGGAYVAKAAPDGYTVLGTSIGPQSIAPHMMGKLSFDPLKDLEPVVLVGMVPHVLVVAPSQPMQSLEELLAAAKANPGQISFASGGNGTILHMQGELLAQRSGVKFIHVPYKGDTPAIQDTMGGQVQFVFAPVAAALPYINSGRLRALAVTSEQRLASLPNVPTMAQAGMKDFVVEQWQAVYLPGRTPEQIVRRLNTEINQVLKDPEIIELAEKIGINLVGGAPAVLAARQQADSNTWANVIKAGNMTAQ